MIYLNDIIIGSQGPKFWSPKQIIESQKCSYNRRVPVDPWTQTTRSVMHLNTVQTLRALFVVGLASVATLRERVALSKTQAYWAIRSLERDGLVEPWGTPRRAQGVSSRGTGCRYAVTEAGIRALVDLERERIPLGHAPRRRARARDEWSLWLPGFEP